ncbi:T9SS type A sorting domain-containing protein, partial [bacterium]|nr:T9SS type A sorting domain-containing protein [bacterium]
EWTVKVTDGEPATVVYGQTAEASITNTHKVGSIGDFVWDDTNRNGIQDAGEPGVEGVTVKLFTTGGVQVGSTQTTDANGGYLFTNVPAGSYYVEFSNIPSGYEFTDSNQGGDDEKDSDADQTTGKTGTITLAAGQNDLTNDAGIREQYGSIGNFVWDDLNKNGIQDQGEPGVEGVTVKLFKSSDNTQVGSTQTTNASGEYLFDNLPAGSYYVEFSNLPADYAFTTANAGTDDAFDSDANVLTGKTGTIPLAAGQDDLTNDAGIIEAEWDYGDAPASYPTLYASNGARHQLGSGLYLGNGVDSDSDGQPTAGTVGDDEDGTDDEDGVVFSVMPLMRGVTSAIWVTASGQGFLNAWLDFNHDGDWDDAGEQIFAGQALNAGVNLLYITTPVSAVIGDTTYARFRFSSLQQLGVSGDAPDGEVEDYMIEISDPFVSIGDYVWHDLNEDGIQDENEVGIENVTVHLFLVPNTPGVTLPSTVAPDGADAGAAAPNSEVSLAVEVGTDITDADGKYLFERVFTGAGTYYLKFDLPGSDWFISARDQGSDDEKDSDADQVDGTCDLTILVDGEIDLSWDCGMYLREPNCSIGDFVWWDLNQNGLQDEGPGSGIANVTLYLHLGHANGPVIATQVTDENGFYYFMNLRPGAYTVDVVESTLPSTPLPIQLTTGNEPYTYGLSPNEHHRQADFGYYVPEATGIGRRWVIARYQPWFSDTDAGDPMRHWDWSNHGGEADTSIFHGYDSYDADIWTYHILAAWASGIDGFAVDWYGKDSYENPPVLGLLNAADKLYRQYADRGFNFEIAVSYNEHAEEELDKNMEYIGDSLMTHIAYWGHRRGEPRPLFIFDDKQDTLITADAYRVVADSLLPADKFLLWDGTELEVFKPMDVCYPWIQPLHDEWDPAGMEWGETYLDTTYWRMNYLPNPGELWFALGAVWPGLNDREWSFSEDHFMDRQDTLVYHWTWEKVHEYPYPLNMPWCYIETWNDFNQASEIEPSVDHDYYFNVMTRNNARIFKGSLPPDSVGVENPGLIVPQHILQARREALLHPEAADWINARADEALDLFFERKFYEATWLADFAAGIAPKPVSITGVTNTTMTLAWDTTKYANSYNVYYSQHPEAFLPGAYERPVRIRLDDVTTYTIEGLEPGVQYFVAVTAVDTSIGEFTESWFSSSYTGAGVVSAALPARPGLSTGVASALPDKFALHNNYPNPFNPTTTITYDLPRAQHVLLRVLDVTGRQVAVLVDDNRDAGFHSVQFSGAELSTGVYFFQIVTDEFKAVQRMLLMK